MTTTSNDNHHEDQHDMRGENLPPHQRHPGTENSELTIDFHRNPIFIVFGVCVCFLRPSCQKVLFDKKN